MITVIILLVILVWGLLAIRHIIKNKNKCCGNCSDCCMDCEKGKK